MDQQSTLGRGLEILSAVCELGPTNVEAIATRLGLPVSTTYRYVRALRELGYVQEYDGYYGTGARVLGLLWSVDLDESLARLASPLLFELVSRTSHTASLVVPDGDLARTVIVREPHRPVRLSFRTGALLPLHAGAPAKALLAHMPTNFLTSYLGQRHAEAFSSRMLDVELLIRELDQIRETGVCLTRGEVDANSVGIAVPIFRNDDLLAAISVAGPASRLDDRGIKEAERLLIAAARQLEGMLNGSVGPDRVSLTGGLPVPKNRRGPPARTVGPPPSGSSGGDTRQLTVTPISRTSATPTGMDDHELSEIAGRNAGRE